jgi:conjugal transfer pilus assembly protein TraV
MKKISLIVASTVMLGGCFPYDTKFMCEKNADYGRCTSMQGAYEDAVSGKGDSSQPQADTDHQDHGDDSQDKDPKADKPSAANVSSNNRNRYKDAEYRQMRALIDSPVTPVVMPPKVLRTLVVAYSTDSSQSLPNTLYLPRYVFYIADESHFVLGDFLNQVPDVSPTLYPNGHGVSTNSLVPESH